LRRVQLNREQWQQLLASYWAPNIYLFAYESESNLQARMFAPAMGIAEDPATGSAATAIAGYLGIGNLLADGTLQWTVKQGVEMGRPSLIQVEADKQNGEIKAIRVGGTAVLVSEGTMEIPEI